MIINRAVKTSNNHLLLGRPLDLSLARILCAICIAMFAAGCDVIRPHVASVTLVNESQGSLKQVDLEVCGQKFTKSNQLKGEKWLVRFKLRGDCSYDLTVHYADGRIVDDEFGYVTVGMKPDQRIVITDGEFAISAVDPP